MVIDNIQENTAFGAAILAGIGAGIYHSADNAFQVIKRKETVISPDPGNAKIYRALYERFYRDLYDNLSGVNHSIEEVLKIIEKGA
jgi:sugar (pentulose or hexulose) kinase